MAAYHQFHAVNKAVEATVEAVAGDQRVGVVWHTQGSGKSLSMAFYAGKLVQQPEMANPTLVVLTDRNDLDDQLFGTFAGCQDLLRQTPGAGREPRRPAGQAAGRLGRRRLHHHPEVPARRARRARIRCSASAPTSWSSPTRPTAASTTSSMASPGTCATPCPTPPLSASPARRSNSPTRTPAPSSATTSTPTTSSAPSKTAPPCRSTTRAASPRSTSPRPRSRRSTPTLRRSPRPRSRSAARSSRASGRASRRWSAPTSASRWSPRTWSSTSRRARPATRRPRPRRWWSA